MKFNRLRKTAIICFIIALVFVPIFALQGCSSSSATKTQSYVTYDTFNKYVIEQSHAIPVLVYFYRYDCPFCPRPEPHIRSLVNNPHQDFIVMTADMHPNTTSGMVPIWDDLRHGYSVFDPNREDNLHGVPGFVLFKDGEPIMRRAGLRESRQGLVDMVMSVLN